MACDNGSAGNGRRIAGAIGQLRATVQAPVSGSEAHVVGWGRGGGRPARWSASIGNDGGGCRRWWVGTVVRPPSSQVSSVVRASGGAPPLRVHLSSPSHLSVRAYSEQERRAGGVGGGGGTTPTLSCLAVPIKDVSE